MSCTFLNSSKHWNTVVLVFRLNSIESKWIKVNLRVEKLKWNPDIRWADGWCRRKSHNNVFMSQLINWNQSTRSFSITFNWLFAIVWCKKLNLVCHHTIVHVYRDSRETSPVILNFGFKYKISIDFERWWLWMWRRKQIKAFAGKWAHYWIQPVINGHHINMKLLLILSAYSLHVFTGISFFVLKLKIETIQIQNIKTNGKIVFANFFHFREYFHRPFDKPCDT